MRGYSLAVASSALYCVDVFPPPLIFRGPLDKTLVPVNTGCPLYFVSQTMNGDCSKPISSDPSPRNDQCLLERIAFTTFFVAFLASINVVVHRHEDDSILEIFWLKVIFLTMFSTSGKRFCVVCPGKIFHSNTTGFRQYCPAHDTEEFV